MREFSSAELMDFLEEENFIFELKSQSLIRLSGKDHIKFLNGISSNEVTNLSEGASIHNLILTNKGKILFDICIFKINGNSIYIQTNSNQIDSLIEYLTKYRMSFDVKINNLSKDYKILKAKGCDLDNLLSFNSPISLEENFKIIFIERGHEKALEEEIMDEELYVQWKIINGIPSYPYEIHSGVIPIEANMWSAISFTKGCYIGQEIIARIRYRGQVKRTLACMKTKSNVQINQVIKNNKDEDIGHISSKVYLPKDNITFALGFLNHRENVDKNEVFLSNNKARIVKNKYQIKSIESLQI